MKGNAVAEYEFMTSMFGKFTYNSVYWYNTNDAEYQYNETSANYKWMVIGK